MAIVKIPAPPKSAMNQHRPVSGLLKSQILHLQEAEFRLPAEYQTNIYIHAIRTEGDAGEYIRQVTEAIHRAHATRLSVVKKRKPAKTFKIAAAAAGKPGKKKARKASSKKASNQKNTKKKK